MRLNQLLLLALGVAFFTSCKKEGCTDQSAINYDEKAKNDDGSCIYDDVNPNNPNDPNNQELPIELSGTESGARTLENISSDPNVVEYYVTGNWAMDAAVTIEPGVRIEMRAGAAININSNGSLNAAGTASNSIEIFGAQNTSGFWENIIFRSNNPNNQLIYCNISNGSSSYGEPGMVTLKDDAQVKIQNSSFTKADKDGLALVSNTCQLPDFQSNNFDECGQGINGGQPIYLETLAQASFLDGNTQTGATSIGSNSGSNQIYIEGGNYSASFIVPKMDVPYNIGTSFDINGGHTDIDPGVELIMDADTKITVNTSGSLAFNGSAGNRSIVRGEQPAQGYWGNIDIRSNNPNNQFHYTDFSDGSGTYGEEATIYLKGSGRLEMSNCTISNGSEVAVDADTPGNFTDGGGNDASGNAPGGGLLP